MNYSEDLHAVVTHVLDPDLMKKGLCQHHVDFVKKIVSRWKEEGTYSEDRDLELNRLYVNFAESCFKLLDQLNK